jgi:hypothetical protein
MVLESKQGGSLMAPEGGKTKLISCRFLFVLMLAFLLGGCEGEEDPCTQHIGINGFEPFYYYTGDCGEGVTGGTTGYPSVPYSVHFDESFLGTSSRDGTR